MTILVCALELSDNNVRLHLKKMNAPICAHMTDNYIPSNHKFHEYERFNEYIEVLRRLEIIINKTATAINFINETKIKSLKLFNLYIKMFIHFIL